ncbi:MAG: Kdo domain containing protein [Bacteroidetes bacterium]|nr:MAG: Kdo domain containing protein [Bacteroidota bacterium]
MNRHFQKDYLPFKVQIQSFIDNFNSSGTQLGHAKRNSIKLFKLNDETINIKSFKIPNIFNQIAYKYFRKSKAQRSFEYANKLIDLEIGTPQPIAYFEYKSLFLFKKSFYVSKQLECDLTYRELINDDHYKNHEEILRAFTRFTFELHEKGILFKDHSPGNTLIKLTSDGYKFYLVDLNRMEFKEISIEERIENFKRLTPKKEMIVVMANEYSKLIGIKEDEVFNKMWDLTTEFQKKFHKKSALKQKYFFWRSKK